MTFVPLIVVPGGCQADRRVETKRCSMRMGGRKWKGKMLVCEHTCDPMLRCKQTGGRTGGGKRSGVRRGEMNEKVRCMFKTAKAELDERWKHKEGGDGLKIQLEAEQRLSDSEHERMMDRRLKRRCFLCHPTLLCYLSERIGLPSVSFNTLHPSLCVQVCV